jgi:hypothetical protein
MKTADILEELRPTLKHACNLGLLDFLASYKTRRKVTIGGQQYLSFVGANDRDTMLLPLGKRGVPHERIRCPDEMREFYSAFDGLRERKPPSSGYFVPCAQAVAVGDKLDAEDFPGFRKYVDCPIVFFATNGDQMIQTADGKFAWCVVSENKVRKLAPSFPNLLDGYVAYRRVGDGRPFDSYGR